MGRRRNNKIHFYDRLLAEGPIVTEYGKLGCGMTSANIYLTEKMLEKGYKIYTNVRFVKTRRRDNGYGKD